MGVLLALLTLTAWLAVVVQALSMTSAGGMPADTAMGGTGMARSARLDDPMAAGRSAVEELTRFVGTWAVMMAAMMLPAIAPRMLLYRRVAARTNGSRGGTVAPEWLMALGYLLVWALFGVPVYVANRIVTAGLDGNMSLVALAPYGAAALLILTGVYQFTPLVTRFLERCRAPLGSLRTHWRPGSGGGLQMGVGEGLSSVGCCWLVMLSLVGAGGMGLAWVVAASAVVLAEKLLPRGRQIARVAGFMAMLAGGLLVLEPGLAGVIRG